MIRIIANRNIPIIIKKMERYDSAIILGKGPTFKPIQNNNDTTLNIAINETIVYSDHVDMLVLNDFIAAKNILRDAATSKIENLKYLLIPHTLDLLEHNHREILNIFTEVCRKSYAIIHNLPTEGRPINVDFVTLQEEHHYTSSHTASIFISKYLHNVTSVNLYGVAILNQDCAYSKKFQKYDYWTSCSKTRDGKLPSQDYDENLIKEIKENIEKTLNGIKVNFN